MKHAFLMMAHKQPELIERIISRIEAPNHYIYIHYDAKSSDFGLIESIAQKHQNIYLTARLKISWGGFSESKCEMINLEMMRNAPEKYDYFHLISGQDYPCVSVEGFDSFFDECQGRSYSFLDSEEETLEARKGKFKYRMENYFTNDFLDKDFMGTKLFRIVNKLLRPLPRPYKAMDSLWGGWQWFSVSRPVLDYMLDYLQNNQQYTNRFKYTTCSSELIITTILKHAPKELNIETSNALRFVEWHPKRESKTLPLLLKETEYDDVIDSGAFFCRKVQLPESEKLLNMLDRHMSEATK